MVMMTMMMMMMINKSLSAFAVWPLYCYSFKCQITLFQLKAMLRLPTLKYRRIRGDMIEVFKVVSGKYDSSVSIQIPINEISSTRGNKYKLIKDCCRLDIRNYSFASRIVW